MIQGYHFGEAGNYSVYWDNVTATAIPEPASGVLASALAALGFVGWRRRRASPNAHPLRDRASLR